MPVEITMPQLSDTMAEGTVVKWLKKEGDKVKAGESIAEVETDKATMEMEAFEPGVLALIAAKEGSKVKVGGRIAVLAAAGENAADVKKEFSGSNGGGATKTAEKAPPKKAEAESKPQSQASEASQSVTPAPKRAAAEDDRVRISPLARRLAEEKGIDLSQLEGSGPGGRIVQRDIEAALSGGAPAQRAEAKSAPSKPSSAAAPSLAARVPS